MKRRRSSNPDTTRGGRSLEVRELVRRFAAMRSGRPFPGFLHVSRIICAIYLTGCAGRQPVVNRGQPPPSQPAPVSAEKAEAAARELDMIGPGVVPVRLEVLSGGDPTAGFFAVQVGAFLERANAERLRDRMSASYSPVFIQTYESPDGLYYRVRVGKISGEDAARRFGEQLRQKEGFTPFVVRLDDASALGEKP